MNILLVYPEFPDTFWSFKHALKFIRKRAVLPPLGLLTVAAMLPKKWNKRLIDTNVRSLLAKDLEWADFVFISAMVIQRDSTRQIIDWCKKLGVKVVAGGPLFTCEPELFDDVDYLILNEAEATLQPFLDDFDKGCLKHIYASSEFPDITSSPVPLWELAELNRYDSIGLQFSRGCPFNCDFCNVTVLNGHKPRTKTAAQVVAELDYLYRLGWRKNVFFVDDNFIGNKKQIKSEILPALIEWRKGKNVMPFQTEVSINLSDDEELMDLMVEAGFIAVFIGIETPSTDSLTECHKGQNVSRDLVKSVKTIQHHGIQVQGGFIVGFDHDTPNIFQQQIDFIQKSGIVTAMVGLLQAPYGTQLYQRLMEEGRLRLSISGDNMDGTTNILASMGNETLKNGYHKLLEYLYSPQIYYERVKTFLREYRVPKVQTPLDFQYIMAFFRSAYKLGMQEAERVYYWKLFFWTLFHDPRLIPLAVTFAIYGFHFRKVVELHIQ